MHATFEPDDGAENTSCAESKKNGIHPAAAV
jgi:hypothetical protein